MFVSNSPRLTTTSSSFHNKNIIYKAPTIQCAFHESQYITHFCNYKACLLPLCKQCILIHRKQHSNIPQPIHLIHVDQAINQLHSSINNQNQRTDQFMNQINLQYQMSNNLHGNLKRNIIQQRDKIIDMVYQTYQPYFRNLDANFQRRQKWFHQLQNQFRHMKEQIQSLKKTLNGQKYLRTLIMWHRVQPGQIINDMMNKITRQWDTPDYTPFDPQQFTKCLNRQLNLKTLEIQGNFGLNKLIKNLRTVKFGQDKSNKNPHKGIGISITDQKRMLRQKSKEGLYMNSPTRQATKADQ